MSTRIETRCAAAFAGALLIALLCACQRQEGPAEHAGKELDQAVEHAGEQVEKAGEKIQDVAKGDKKIISDPA